MRPFYYLLFLLTLIGCTSAEESHGYTRVTVKNLFTDTMSIRALEVMDGSVAFAGTNGLFGTIDTQYEHIRSNQQTYDTLLPEFRAIGHTQSDFFMLSAGRPALLYKTSDSGKMELVYKEDSEGVFYDAMAFWNDREGIAIGDAMAGCLSILITRDGGHTWNKTACDQLPPALQGEGAFAASNTNIAIVGEQAWVGTTAGRVYYSPDKGKTWQVTETPVRKNDPTEGIYSVAFYSDKQGIIVGGDYSQPENTERTVALTNDGGKQWLLGDEANHLEYKSCVQYIPHSGGNDLVAVGFTGISYSNDKGMSWKELSEESFYTIRFVNDSIAYAAGRDRIALLRFN
jgi:photosystem II stability/assembly factor-like uncharacterized protein